MENKRTGSYFGMGAVSLTVVIVVLAIACFAVLTFVSADSDYKLAVRTATSVKEYYAADSEAVRIAAGLYSSMNEGTLSSGKDGSVDIFTQNGETCAAYKVDIDANRCIDIIIQLNSDAVTTVKWQTVTAATQQ